MPNQTQAGKAFEYALIQEAYSLLSQTHQVKIELNSEYKNTKNSFELYDSNERQNYLKAANASIVHITELEPRLNNTISQGDILTLKISSDRQGIIGDVRDVLFIRSNQNWEIGVSAKNNHKAVKHSRLSDKIDFGEKWLGLSCSQEYFNEIEPLFIELRELTRAKLSWKDLDNKALRFYVPLLEAFKKELIKLNTANIGIVPSRLLEYLLGNKDFYKVIKKTHKTEILGFNLHGTLNQSVGKTKPLHKVSKLKLPSRIIELSFKPNSTDTLLLACDEGWQISFRIHNARTKVEPSLKFDINLIGQPQSLYTHHIAW